MKKLILVLALVLMPGLAHAVDCAFEDLNDNQVFDGADVIVPDASWLGGVPFVTANPFVVPVGCNKLLALGPAVSNGVNVLAAKISLFGNIQYLPAGGKGIVFIATGDLQVGDGFTPVSIKAGGQNALPKTEIAVAGKSVALVGGGVCHFAFATIEGVSPIQATDVGIRCQGDMTFRATTVLASGVNIQSLAGKIDASNGAGPQGGLLSLASRCDDPAFNLTGNGDLSGTITPGDFPCDLNLGGVVSFADPAALAAACQPALFSNPPGNRFIALNDPLIIIAGAGSGDNVLDLRFALVAGRFRVTLAAEDASILTQNATIDNAQQLGFNPPGGAKIWLFADSTTVVRLPVDREDFLGPSAGSTFIQDACFTSKNDINVGRDAALSLNLVGTPAPPPCAQLADFVGVLNGIF